MTEEMYVNAVVTVTQWHSHFRMDTEARLKTESEVFTCCSSAPWTVPQPSANFNDRENANYMQYDFNKQKGKEAVLWRFVTAHISSNALNRQTRSQMESYCSSL